MAQCVVDIAKTNQHQLAACRNGGKFTFEKAGRNGVDCLIYGIHGVDALFAQIMVLLKSKNNINMIYNLIF